MHENIVQKTTSDTSNTWKHSLTPKPNEFVWRGGNNTCSHLGGLETVTEISNRVMSAVSIFVKIFMMTVKHFVGWCLILKDLILCLRVHLSHADVVVESRSWWETLILTSSFVSLDCFVNQRQKTLHKIVVLVPFLQCMMK